MTGSEMILSFDQYYDKIANLAAAGYTEAEKLRFLNNAQDKFVKERAFGKNFQPPAFDDNEKRVADIRLLLWTDTVVVQASTHFGGSTAAPIYLNNTDLRYLLKLEVLVTRTNPEITSTWLPATKISLGDVDKFRNTEFNKTWFKNPVYFNADYGYVFIIGDSYTSAIDNARITYIRSPQTITALIGDYIGVYSSSYMSLESHVHQEIVEIAVKDALDVSGDQRLQPTMIKDQTETT